ncbi:MAG: BrnT family toxin [Comamonadaceae bacterium]|nr:BrnT family toxin [Comamonadaceae bacterium]
MDYTFDPDKAAVNLRKHGVDFDEAAICLLDDMALVREDRDAIGEQRNVLLGMSAWGSLLVVVYTMRGDVPRIISARKPTAKERKQYAS